MAFDPSHDTLLITGAGGALGSLLVREFRGRYRLRVTSREAPGSLFDGLEARLAELTDRDAMDTLMDGVHTVVHLGGRSLEGSWNEILASNIDGTHAVFDAAHRNGVKRIVYASSHHVGGFHRRERITSEHDVPRPDGLYGVSKVFGEALGRLYADKHGMSVICQRIGVCRPHPPHRRGLWAWLSESDFVHLTERCIFAADDVRFLVVYGVSRNRRQQWDNRGANVIGYRPQHDAEAYAADIETQPPEPAFEARFQGGSFCADGFDGDLARID